MSPETREVRLKRLFMRSFRRGTKEMDVVLEGFARAELDNLSTVELDRYEKLLEQNDQDLLLWVTGQQDSPAQFRDIIALISKRISA